MSSPNRPSQESFSSSTKGQSTFLSLSSTSSSDDDRKGPIMRRCFCQTCNCTTIIDPSAAWTVSCPLCCEPFQSEQEGPAAAFPSQSRSNAAVRAAGFEDWRLGDNFFYVPWDYCFFSLPFRNTSSEVIRSVPTKVPIPSAGTVISLPLLQRFLNECINSGASITISAEEETATHSPMSDKEMLLSQLELKDDLLYSCEMTCSVCLDSLANGKKVRVMPCDHLFHENCLLPWLIKEKTCPLCRFKLITESFQIYTEVFINSVEDLRHLGTSGFQFRTNPIIRKFMIEFLWPYGGTCSQAEASNSGGGHDASHIG